MQIGFQFVLEFLFVGDMYLYAAVIIIEFKISPGLDVSCERF